MNWKLSMWDALISMSINMDMEAILNEENDWDHYVKVDTLDYPLDGVLWRWGVAHIKSNDIGNQLIAAIWGGMG